MTEPTASPDVTELLGCPFCGSPPEIVRSWVPRNRERVVRCSNSDCIACLSEQDEQGGWPVSFTDDASAFAAWNRRAPDLALRQEVERLTNAWTIYSGDLMSATNELDREHERADAAEASMRLATQRREDVVEGRPLAVLSPDNGRPEWEQVNDLFERFGRSPPDWRMRDELVVWLLWARYAEALALQPKEN